MEQQTYRFLGGYQKGFAKKIENRKEKPEDYNNVLIITAINRAINNLKYKGSATIMYRDNGDFIAKFPFENKTYRIFIKHEDLNDNIEYIKNLEQKVESFKKFKKLKVYQKGVKVLAAGTAMAVISAATMYAFIKADMKETELRQSQNQEYIDMAEEREYQEKIIEASGGKQIIFPDNDNTKTR